MLRTGNDTMYIMNLYNTLSKSIEELTPLNQPFVTLYTCGPTVYDFTHIGHMRTFVNNDTLKRALIYAGYKVNHVMNVTDVGHLTGDTDEGEDKLEKGAKKSGKTVWEVANFYADNFFQTMTALNVLSATNTCKATDHIEDMLQLIKELKQKGFTYETKEAVYFDISKFPNYGKLSRQKLEDKIQKARDEVNIDPEKKHPADFALWFKCVGRFKDHEMNWDSPYGKGFPGWHIECSAMSMKYLGETIDIHTGGIDHIAVHHENEIAQSEAATGKPFVKIWIHNAFLLVDGTKMSKSLNNFYTIEDVHKHSVNPLALRVLFLQTHYRQEMNFTWDSVNAAQIALKKLQEQVQVLRNQTRRQTLSEDKLKQVDEYRSQFKNSLENDLQTPQAVATVWSMLKSNIPSEDKLDLLYEFDEVLGLQLRNVSEEIVPQEVQDKVTQREKAKQDKDFAKSDELRKQIDSMGYLVEDGKEGTKVKKK